MNVLAVIAHPDDETCFAGFIKKVTNSGGKVLIVCYTGRKQREIELKNSCNVLGAKCILLGFKDLSLKTSLSQEKEIKRLKEIIVKFKPEILITMSSYDYHPDHKVLNELVRLAAEFASHGEVDKAWLVKKILTFEDNNLLPYPDLIIDITDEFSYKLLSLKQHVSQLSSAYKKNYYTDLAIKLAELRGVMGGCKYAEACNEIILPVHGNFYCENRLIKNSEDVISYGKK
ncbi:hypothetical protein COV13_01200 [Candidatus Woesearchaeota archaeon CG10_big_fil_rev_8_21_14_0_10_32_9]|nr:MAG: hypothetical protein COV13_01200 [Candidatus Woesearchaeota archaeon CG10_big_fil_rev_8_21_14_0_10_32_9]